MDTADPPDDLPDPPAPPPPSHSSSSPAKLWSNLFTEVSDVEPYLPPTSFLADGTPVVTAPSEILLAASETWKGYILCTFFGNPPHPKKIFSDLNPIWGRNGTITVKNFTQSTCLIFIPHLPTRKYVTDMGFWSAGTVNFTAIEWTSTPSLVSPQLTSAPVWLTLREIPPQLWSPAGLRLIASGVGKVFPGSRPTLPPDSLGSGKIRAIVELLGPFPPAVMVKDKLGNSVLISVEYGRLPVRCSHCQCFGHAIHRCPRKSEKLPATVSVPSLPDTSSSPAATPATAKERELRHPSGDSPPRDSTPAKPNFVGPVSHESGPSSPNPAPADLASSGLSAPGPELTVGSGPELLKPPLGPLAPRRHRSLSPVDLALPVLPSPLDPPVLHRPSSSPSPGSFTALLLSQSPANIHVNSSLSKPPSPSILRASLTQVLDPTSLRNKSAAAPSDSRASDVYGPSPQSRPTIYSNSHIRFESPPSPSLHDSSSSDLSVSDLPSPSSASHITLPSSATFTNEDSETVSLPLELASSPPLSRPSRPSFERHDFTPFAIREKVKELTLKQLEEEEQLIATKQSFNRLEPSSSAHRKAMKKERRRLRLAAFQSATFPTENHNNTVSIKPETSQTSSSSGSFRRFYEEILSTLPGKT